MEIMKHTDEYPKNQPSSLRMPKDKTLSNEAIDLIRKSDEFAKVKLSSISRGDGSNAYQHSVRVANYITSELMSSDPTTLITAILHDTVEDTNCTTYYIASKFGYTVAEYVSALTRTGQNSINNDFITKLHIKTVQNLSLYNKPKEVQLVKCVDRIDNLRSANVIPKDHPKFERIPYWIVETESSLLQLSKRLDPQIHQDMLRELNKQEKRFELEVGSIRNDYKAFLAQF
jgi:(p)ppGpp synthase/HD superfamily hydrolase